MLCLLLQKTMNAIWMNASYYSQGHMSTPIQVKATDINYSKGRHCGPDKKLSVV